MDSGGNRRGQGNCRRKLRSDAMSPMSTTGHMDSEDAIEPEEAGKRQGKLSGVRTTQGSEDNEEEDPINRRCGGEKVGENRAN